jgi:DNA ligase-1
MSIEEMKNIYEKALYAGYEGLVLKDPYGEYELKRSKSWLKVKQVLDEDCPIVGFFEGEGKYAGMLGGVVVRRKNGYISKVGGGFSDSLRAHIWNQQGGFLGKHIEVRYQNDTPDGDFRQARFKKFRSEKDV